MIGLSCSSAPATYITRPHPSSSKLATCSVQRTNLSALSMPRLPSCCDLRCCSAPTQETRTPPAVSALRAGNPQPAQSAKKRSSGLKVENRPRPAHAKSLTSDPQTTKTVPPCPCKQCLPTAPDIRVSANHTVQKGICLWASETSAVRANSRSSSRRLLPHHSIDVSGSGRKLFVTYPRPLTHWDSIGAIKEYASRHDAIHFILHQSPQRNDEYNFRCTSIIFSHLQQLPPRALILEHLFNLVCFDG